MIPSTVNLIEQAKHYLWTHGILDPIYVVRGVDADKNEYFLSTQQGVARWQSDMGFAILNKGFWLTKQYANSALKDGKAVYQEAFLKYGQEGQSLVSCKVEKAKI